MSCMQAFTASNGEVVTETGEGHRVFATPPCKWQLRLAIVVAAETLPFVIGGSSCVKGRNCALDVCWEGKNFRVICSHLNPLSVMHLYAKDLDDLCLLAGDVTWKRYARPYLCGRSDGPGDNATKTVQRKHWCYSCLTSCRKTKNVRKYHHGKPDHSHEHFRQQSAFQDF